MPAVVYKLSYHHRNYEQAGRVLQKGLQYLVMVKWTQVMLRAEERRNVTFKDVGMAHVKCLLLNVTDLSQGFV